MSGTVFASTACIRSPFADLESHLAAYHAAGVHDVELGWSAPASASDLPAMLAGLRGARFLVHNYFPPPSSPFVLNLASQDPDTLRRSRDMAADAIRLSARLGAPYYSVHAGFRAEFTADALGHSLPAHAVVPLADAQRTFAESIDALAALAAGQGIDLLIEPNVVDRRNLVDGRNELLMLAESGEITRFLSDAARPNLGVLLDTGHLNVTATTLGFGRDAFVDAVAPFIRGFHVHDNDGTGDQHRAFTRESWVLEVLRRPAFREAPVVIEAVFAGVPELAHFHHWLSKELNER